MATKEAIDALLDNEAWDFKSKIEDELYGRAAEALQTKRFEVGSEMFSVEETDTVEKDKEGKVKSWQHTGDWKKSDNKNPRGRVTNLSGIARKKSKILKRQDTDADTLKSNLKTASAAARLSSKMNNEESLAQSMDRVDKQNRISKRQIKKAALELKNKDKSTLRLSSKMNKEEVEGLDELSPALLARAAVKAAGQSVAAKRGFGNKSPTKAGSQASKFRMGQIMRKRKAAADLETDSESK